MFQILRRSLDFARSNADKSISLVPDLLSVLNQNQTHRDGRENIDENQMRRHLSE
jgi:hypothetical protein